MDAGMVSEFKAPRPRPDSYSLRGQASTRHRPPRPADASDTQLIISLCAEHYGVKVDQIKSRCRTATLAWARQVAMYLARKHTNGSLQDIAGQFNKGDHGTVIHAIHMVGKRIDAYPETHREVLRLESLYLQRQTVGSVSQ